MKIDCSKVSSQSIINAVAVGIPCMGHKVGIGQTQLGIEFNQKSFSVAAAVTNTFVATKSGMAFSKPGFGISAKFNF